MNLKIRVSDLPASVSDPAVYVAVTESDLATNVKAGENAGLNLDHVAVVRHVEKVRMSKTESGDALIGIAEIRVSNEWQARSLRVAAFVQDGKTLSIHGAVQQSVTDIVSNSSAK